MTKMTYVAALSFAIENLTDAPAEVLDKLTALREQQIKRNSTVDRKPTKAQTLTASLADIVREVLAAAENPMTIAEILQADDRFAGVSNQKMAAVLRSMADSVEKIPDKRVNRFRLV